MSQRNYPCDNYYSSYYGTRPVYPISALGESALKAQLYLCQLASALNLKSVIEWQRSQNLWGLMEWQLNEVLICSKDFLTVADLANRWLGQHRVRYCRLHDRPSAGRSVEATALFPSLDALSRRLRGVWL